jgi:hypothetical protein
MPIVIVARNGPPEATHCPVLLCDACGARIHTGNRHVSPGTAHKEDRPGIGVDWGRYPEGDGPGSERLESLPMFYVHKGHCDQAFRKYGEQFYRLDDGWSQRWQDVDELFEQLLHNMSHPFEEDPELSTGKVLYYLPAKIVNLLPTEDFVITPKWQVGT